MIKNMLAALLLALLAGCGTTPKAVLYSLTDDNAPLVARTKTPKIAVMPISMPDLIDRPQLVLHKSGRQVVLLEQQRWAEPLRQEIPHVIADDLGQLLNSGNVLALPADIHVFDPDYRLMLDIQKLDAQDGVGVDVDVLWVLSGRQSVARTGRSTLRQALEGSSYSALVEAHRKALLQVAQDINEATKTMPDFAR